MRRIIFVGAPFGGFTRDILPAFERQGCRVWRFVFDGGDRLETPQRFAVSFPDKGLNFAAFARQFIIANKIDTIIVFNDCLPKQAAALRIGEQLGLETFAFENAYFRPNFIVLEKKGINARSRLPKAIEFYREHRDAGSGETSERAASYLRALTRDTILHYAASYLVSPVLPFDTRYYGASVGEQARGYAREFVKRLFARGGGMIAAIAARKQAAPDGARLTTVLLQKPCDTQITASSQFHGNLDFIRLAMTSFAAHAPKCDILVVKEHPLDFGIERCMDFTVGLAASFGISDRVFFLRGTHIDRLMPLTDAMATINSTGGLAGLKAGLPVICLGRAFYDMPGLTFQGALDAFWQTQDRPAHDDVQAFRAYVVAAAQINGGFHSKAARIILARNFTARVLGDRQWPHEQIAPAQRSAALTVVAGGMRQRRAGGDGNPSVRLL